MPSKVLYEVTLANGDRASVYADGLTMIFGKDGKYKQVRHVAANVADRDGVKNELENAQRQPYASNRAIVVFGAGSAPTSDSVTVPAASLLQQRAAFARQRSAALVNGAFSYTNQSYVNTALGKIGADRLTRIGTAISRSQVEGMRMAAQARGAAPRADLANAYVVHFTASNVMRAIASLRGTPGIVFAEPDWQVSTLAVSRAQLSAPQMMQAVKKAAQVRTNGVRSRFAVAPGASELPDNYAVIADAQPMLAPTGVNALAAYDAIKKRFGQYPGQGEIITNVSIGDITDSRALSNVNDPCELPTGFFGPTTRLIGNQHYLDWPGFPLIPAYTVDARGNVLGDAEACNTGDAQDEEIGLDFSMMAPLPHDVQRGGAQASGYADLLGIAPGAQYRLVVPQIPYTSNIVAAFLAAANQTPAPNVITASLGFGFDTQGFPGRYFEEDPLVQSAVATIVGGKNVVVCISANDGTRTYTNAAIGATGGSAATNVVTNVSDQTILDDVGLTTGPSRVIDTGAIDVGGTTMDDIAVVNPSDPANAANPDVRSVPETRYDGFSGFSSGFGSRVNVAAPSDNVLSVLHGSGNYNAIGVVISGGTSASAPQVAAAASVALQVARLTGHPFQKAVDVRAALAQSGNPVSEIPQADQPLNVGPQVDLGRLVSNLMAQSGQPLVPAVPHVSIMQRDSARFDNRFQSGRYFSAIDTTFTTDTDPGYIDLLGPIDGNTGQPNGMRMQEYITIAPDWEGIPDDATYQLSVVNGSASKVLATTRFARFLPAQLLQAAGLPVTSPSTRTIALTYRAAHGYHALAQTTFTLTFGPSQQTTERVLAPNVAPVTTGPTMNIAYDFSAFPSALLANAQLFVSHPGRVNAYSGNLFYPAYIQPLYQSKGTVTVPVSALQGDGIYGIGILLNTNMVLYSDFAYTRVQTAASDARPPAPLFVPNPGSTAAPAHFAELPYGGTARVSYDVSNVPNATGALLEISAAGPTIYGSENTVGNPNGSIVDQNGIDSGSVYVQTLAGTKGTVVLSAAQMNLLPTLEHTVRVIPLSGTGAAGEASDVSFITEDGGVTPDGGSTYGGFSIAGAGTDGLVTSAQPLADGEWLSSVYSFDQRTLAMSAPIAQQNGGYHRFDVPDNGLFAGDAGLFRSMWDGSAIPLGNPIPPFDASTFEFVPNVASAAAPGGAWTPPLATTTTDVVGAGRNSVPGRAAFLIRDEQSLGTDGLAAFVSDVGHNTFGQLVPLDGMFSSFGFHLSAFDYDSSTNTGYVIANQSFFGRVSTPIVSVDFNANTASYLTTDYCSRVGDFVIDPVLHLGFASSLGAPGCGLHYIDLTSGSVRTTSIPAVLGGTVFVRVANDPVNHLFFAEAPISPDAGYNNNSLSSLYVLNSAGSQFEALEQFSFGNGFNSLNINGATRRAFVSGYGSFQIQPFSY